MSPAGADHGSIAAEIIASLTVYVKQRALGKVYSSETGLRSCAVADTVRALRCLVRSRRARRCNSEIFRGAAGRCRRSSFAQRRYGEIEEKTLDWLRAGVRVVVIVDPRTKSARIHRGTVDAPIVIDVTGIEDAVPGWRLPLSEIFDASRRHRPCVEWWQRRCVACTRRTSSELPLSHHEAALKTRPPSTTVNAVSNSPGVHSMIRNDWPSGITAKSM